MNIAINVADLTRHPVIASLLVTPVVRNNIIVNGNPKVLDEGAVVLQCDEKQARAICQVIRDHDDRVNQYRTRVYVQKMPDGTWTKVPNNQALISKKDLKA